MKVLTNWSVGSFLAAAFLCISSLHAADTTPATAAIPATATDPVFRALDAEGKAWVEESLARLDLRHKLAQLMMIRVYGDPIHPESWTYRRWQEEVADLGVGGLVLFRSELDTIPILLDELQAAADLPLLVASDLERSLSFRVADGTVSVPDAMAFGATRSPEAARFLGELTAREGRAVGIHWALAPTVDVNNNPANPVINTRSFGEDPALVSEMTTAFIEGARAGGILTSAKHFPGHGDTAVDSHLALPTLSGDRQRLNEVELEPFRAAIGAGVDSIMIGHLAVPAIDSTNTPATLSATISTDLLRGDLGFEGLVVTDSMGMQGLASRWLGAAVVDALRAGADVLLLPPDPLVALAALERAVEQGELTEERIDRSVRRVLAMKARLGLHRQRFVDHAVARLNVGRPADQARADDIAQASITLLKNDSRGVHSQPVLPLAAESALNILHLVLTDDGPDDRFGRIPAAELALRGIARTTRHLGAEATAESARQVLDELRQAEAEGKAFSHVLVSAYPRVRTASGGADMKPVQADLLEDLAESSMPLIVVSYGSPYVLTQFPNVPAYLCAYGVSDASQRAAIRSVLGERAISGRLPVSIPGLFAYGHGLDLAPRPMTLEALQGPLENTERNAMATRAGFRPERLAEVDRILEAAISDGAFPGAVVAVGRQGRLVHLAAHGRLTYDPDSPLVQVETRYDLASLTKVVATTTVAMKMVDEGRLVLDWPVQAYLQEFTGANKERVTVRHLLTHSSGITWWEPLHQRVEGPGERLDPLEKRTAIAHIAAADLAYEPGSKSVYSDLGMILLGEILERISGQSLTELTESRLLRPLGMQHTGFLPDPGEWSRIAPTEYDPWRGRVVQGEVHDENAFALGGVAPHAGLFGTAPDLARFAQMLLWKGVFEHKRLISRATIESFTQRAKVPGSSRAIGWDTKSATGSSAGSLFSPTSFGHTGFTGTSIWIDPERELFVILLTNRVHPTRETTKIRQIRPAIADAVIRALIEPGVLVRVGLDRIAAGDPKALEILAGKRLGLVAHAASVTADGRLAPEVFLDRGLDLVRLFSPEHGFTGRAAAGERVEDSVEGITGLPIVSLYGEKKKPSPQDLEGLDALVVDLQGAGVRFYTYSSTMIACLEAAAEAGIELILLDRPNPLGGRLLAGPLSAPRDVVPESLVNRAPGPLVHGLTLGEMAYLANQKLAQSTEPTDSTDSTDRRRTARLSVIEMTGWDQAMTWRDTGRDWVPPSPNLRSPEAALAYPGVALLEATNLSEGRGTESPFLLFGAPFLDPAQLPAFDVPGYRLTPTRFTPRSSPAAPAPKFRDQECQGWKVEVVDPAIADPYRLGVTLLTRLSKVPGFAWRRNGAALTWLVGTPSLLEGIEAGRTVDEILAETIADIEAWRAERAAALETVAAAH